MVRAAAGIRLLADAGLADEKPAKLKVVKE